MPSHPTRALIERHEALFPHLEALLKQAVAIAARRPEAKISEATRIAAEALLYECRPFIERVRAERFPAAAPDQAGLATQLGQALAGLSAYETQWSEWDPERKCFCWILPDERLPVRRLRPQVAVVQKAKENPKMAQLRKKLAERIDRKFAAQYDLGYRDGLAAAAAKETQPPEPRQPAL